MFKRVVVGVDGKVGGQDAIALARQLLDSDGVLTLANVWIGDGTDVLEREREAADVDAQLVSAGGDSVATTLHEIADELDADLLVVGSSTRALVERVFLGGVTRAALHDASCPVAVAPCGYSRGPHPLGNLGVGYSGSLESKRALAVGRRLAAETGATLSVIEVISQAPRDTMEDFYNPTFSIQRALRRTEKRLSDLGGVVPYAVFGAPDEELTLFSGSIDLLIVGSRSHGPLGRLLLGSTSLAIVRTVRCPLLVLTRGAVTGELGLAQPVLEVAAR